MGKKPKTPIGNLDPNRPDDRTESGELERPQLKRRRIDCGGEPSNAPEVPRGADRRSGRFLFPPAAEA